MDTYEDKAVTSLRKLGAGLERAEIFSHTDTMLPARTTGRIYSFCQTQLRRGRVAVLSSYILGNIAGWMIAP